MMRWRAAVWIAGAVVSLAAAGCVDVSLSAGREFDADKAEEQIRRQFAQQTGSDATCSSARPTARMGPTRRFA